MSRVAGEGSVYQRADGRWVAAIPDPARPGKKKYRYARSQAEARRKLTGMRTDLDKGLSLPNDRITVGAFLDEWLETSVRPNRSPATFQQYRQYTHKWLQPHLGKTLLVKLRPQDVQRLVSLMQGAGCAPRTIHLCRAVLRSALSQAEKWEIVHRNVAKLVDLPKTDKFEIEPLSAEEGLALIKALESDRLRALYLMALTMGLRSGELRGLRWEDVDLEAMQVHIRQTCKRVNGKLTFGAPKTAQSKRTLPIPLVTAAALIRHKEQQDMERSVERDRWQELGLVFTTRIGTPLDGSSLNHKYHQALEGKDLRRHRIHDLRHSCATLLFSQGVEPRLIMEILGHSQISLTLNTYVTPGSALSRSAIATMDSLFLPQPDSSD